MASFQTTHGSPWLCTGAGETLRSLDPAAVWEALFESNGWGDTWRDGIYDYLHYHSRMMLRLLIGILGAAVEPASWPELQFLNWRAATLCANQIWPEDTDSCRMSRCFRIAFSIFEIAPLMAYRSFRNRSQAERPPLSLPAA